MLPNRPGTCVGEFWFDAEAGDFYAWDTTSGSWVMITCDPFHPPFTNPEMLEPKKPTPAV